MKRRLTLRQFRSLLRVEVVLLGLMLAGALVGFGLLQQVGKARAEQVTLERRAATVRQTLGQFKAKDNLAPLKEELGRLEAAPKTHPLPSRQQALGFSSAMVSYAAERGLQLTAFGSGDTASELKAGEHPAITYSITAEGKADTLVGALGLAEEFPSNGLRKLEFTRAATGQEAWVMKLDLAVLYGK